MGLILDLTNVEQGDFEKRTRVFNNWTEAP